MNLRNENIWEIIESKILCVTFDSIKSITTIIAYILLQCKQDVLQVVTLSLDNIRLINYGTHFVVFSF